MPSEGEPAAPWIRYLAEFVGTFLLVFTVGCNVLAGSPVWGATSIACTLMVSIYCLGGVSGANLNPAVSLALGLSQKLAWKEVAIYSLVQTIGGLCAAFSYSALFSKVFALAPSAGFGFWEPMLAEGLYTCMLSFVVLNCAASLKNNPPDDGNQFYGLAIGFVVIAGGYGAGSISGGAFNPAVAIGIDVSSVLLGDTDHPEGIPLGMWGGFYVLAELVGACLAAGLFRIVRPDDFGGSADYSLLTRIVAEFVGTFFLVLTVGLNVLGGSPAAAWSIAASLMCMVFSLGNCSGAHFNPAVTMSLICSGRNRCSLSDGAAYICVQLLAGVVASFTYSGMHHGSTIPLQPGKDFMFWQAAVVEFIFTSVLCFVVLCVASVEQPKLRDFFGLAIGSCVTAGGLAAGAVSGGSLNPAVSLGISASHVLNYGLVNSFLVYSFAEVLGGMVAALIFYITHPLEYKVAPPDLDARERLVPGGGTRGTTIANDEADGY